MSEWSERLKTFLDVKEEEDKTVLSDFNKLNKKGVFIALVAPYFGVKISPSIEASASFGISEEFGVEEVIERIKEKSDCKNLYLLIDSPGGFVSSSYKIAKALRKNFEHITVFIPHCASSGGTVISLIGDEIIMGMMSELGPIDPSNGRFSSLSILRGFTSLVEYFKDKQKDDAPYPYIALAENFTFGDLDDAVSSLNMVEKYANEILTLGKRNEEDSKRIAETLTRDFYVHKDVIDIDAAKNIIGERVKSKEEFKEEWEAMRKWLSKYLLQSSDKHIIRYFIMGEKSENGKEEC